MQYQRPALSALLPSPSSPSPFRPTAAVFRSSARNNFALRVAASLKFRTQNSEKERGKYAQATHARVPSARVRPPTATLVVLLYALNYACARFTTAIAIIAVSQSPATAKAPRFVVRQWTIKYKACTHARARAGFLLGGTGTGMAPSPRGKVNILLGRLCFHINIPFRTCR